MIALRALRFATIAAMLMLLSSPALSQVSVTAFGGYAVSEGIENDTTGERASVKSAAAFGAAADYDLDSARQLQLFYGQQATSLNPGGGVPRFDIDVRYLHVGGTYFFDGPIGSGPYAVGGLGVTHFSPSMNGLSSETRASLNVGFGYLWPIGRAIAMRIEARGFFTLLNSSGGLFCSGGCTVVLSGDSFVQGQAMLGLTARF
ncbi:MAG TPA: outer membrane beta-barrel protein [Burkholderiaceae bacterium]|nr:outer membrane beta-barrel protein [Burkholderiaceae bacterium]